jgi:hypothetical protein
MIDSFDSIHYVVDSNRFQSGIRRDSPERFWDSPEWFRDSPEWFGIVRSGLGIVRSGFAVMI